MGIIGIPTRSDLVDLLLNFCGICVNLNKLWWKYYNSLSPCFRNMQITIKWPDHRREERGINLVVYGDTENRIPKQVTFMSFC